jgi:predicted DNA-binding antitoxin AbrB/MazE fold protein
MNMNELARKVTLAEGKKVSVSIAQVKEILSILRDFMLDDFDVFICMINKPNRKAKKKSK